MKAVVELECVVAQTPGFSSTAECWSDELWGTLMKSAPNVQACTLVMEQHDAFMSSVI